MWLNSIMELIASYALIEKEKFRKLRKIEEPNENHKSMDSWKF